MLHLTGHAQAVQALAFSPDSTLLASGSKDGGLRLWDAAGGLVREVSGPTRAERKAIHWNPNGTAFAVTNRLEFATVSADGGRTDLHAGAWKSPVTAVAHLSAALLVVGTGTAGVAGGGLYLWDLAAKKPRPLKRLEADGVRAVATHPATKLAAWVSAMKLSLWDVTKATPKVVPLGGPGGAAVLSPDGLSAAVAVGWTVRRPEVARDGEREALRGHKGHVAGVAFVPDGRRVVTGGWDETVRLWDAVTGRETACYELRIGKVNAVAVSPDGSRVAAGSLEGGLAVFDLE